MECDARRVKVFQSRLCAQAWVGGICYGNPVGVLRLVAARAQVWKGPSGDSSSRPYARNPDGFSGFLFCFRLDVCGRGHPPGQAAASAWSGTPGCAGWAATGPHGAWYAGRPATRWNREHAGKMEANPPAGETRNARSPDAERHPGSCVVGGRGACAPFPPGAEKASRGPVRSSRRQPYGTRRCCRRAHSCRARRTRRRCCGRR